MKYTSNYRSTVWKGKIVFHAIDYIISDYKIEPVFFTNVSTNDAQCPV